MATWTMHATYDAGASVWYPTDCDFPGLHLDSLNPQDLLERAALMAADLLQEMPDLIPEGDEGPHLLRLIARYESETIVVA